MAGKSVFEIGPDNAFSMRKKMAIELWIHGNVKHMNEGYETPTNDVCIH